MATQDVMNATMAQLATLATPVANSALAALLAQRDALLTQLQALQRQIEQSMTADQKEALRTMQQLAQRGRMLGVQVTPVATALATAKAAASATVTPAPVTSSPGTVTSSKPSSS